MWGHSFKYCLVRQFTVANVEKVKSYLEDAVHGDRKRAFPRILRDLEDVDTPSVYVLQFLLSDNKHRYTSLQHTVQWRVKERVICDHTFARSPSWLELTPKRGMVEGARLGLWVAFFTPLIWDMGRFFLSFSLAGGDMMSMSCCFSVR